MQQECCFNEEAVNFPELIALLRLSGSKYIPVSKIIVNILPIYNLF